MYIETDPRLVNDPCWSAIEKALTALREQPRLLHDKKPEWEEGLNSIAINNLVESHNLSNHLVFGERVDSDEFDVIQTRWVDIYHSDLNDPISVCTWDRVEGWGKPSAAKLKRIESYLRAWMNKRTEQLLSNSSESKAESKFHHHSDGVPAMNATDSVNEDGQPKQGCYPQYSDPKFCPPEGWTDAALPLSKWAPILKYSSRTSLYRAIVNRNRFHYKRDGRYSWRFCRIEISLVNANAESEADSAAGRR